MKVSKGSDFDYVPASHEDFRNPGVLKKVLFGKLDIRPGRVQMVNWASMPAGRSFLRHYHEDMDEVFVIVSGSVEMTVGAAKAILGRGDAIIVHAGEQHEMKNISDGAVEYIVFGISSEEGGKTVNAP